MRFRAWRLIHRGASGFIGIMGVLHMGLTFALYDVWGPEALWFVGTGLGLVLLSGMNWAHVGLGPCRMPTAPAVRYANVVYALFGTAAVVAVPEPHAWALVVALATQAAAGFATLVGPAGAAWRDESHEGSELDDDATAATLEQPGNPAGRS